MRITTIAHWQDGLTTKVSGTVFGLFEVPDELLVQKVCQDFKKGMNSQVDSGRIVSMEIFAESTKEYQCAVCKRMLESDRSNEEAYAEMVSLHGEIPQDQIEVVCERCYKTLSG